MPASDACHLRPLLKREMIVSAGFCDQLAEWYLNRSAGALYIWPLGSQCASDTAMSTTMRPLMLAK